MDPLCHRVHRVCNFCLDWRHTSVLAATITSASNAAAIAAAILKPSGSDAYVCIATTCLDSGDGA
jgi:hypothetical protein